MGRTARRQRRRPDAILTARFARRRKRSAAVERGAIVARALCCSRSRFYASNTALHCESDSKMCENREHLNDIEAIREELAALIRLSSEKLEEMKHIQSRIDDVTSEIARLTQQLEELDGRDA